MSEMVERVARAMYVSFKGLPQAQYSWEDLAHNANDPLVQNYRRMARAAIEAMREPTMKMLMAAHRIDSGNNALIEIDDLRDAWRRMSDEALK